MSKKNKLIKKQQQLINLYQKLINGGDGKYGLLNCLDHYYNGAFDKEIKKIERLKKKIEEKTKTYAQICSYCEKEYSGGKESIVCDQCVEDGVLDDL